ncbi:GtrA family protein [Candidatus Ferrigenium straubiae]|jgi:putative flippase GtrA|uniref:GtrA family protein n=1 Tax=Candidatus Ferrigenium straubiae TaxID=2919506 RepID=UPI003F4A9D1E
MLVKQIFSYGLLGIIRNTLGYLIYLLVTYFGVPPKWAISILYAAGATVGFFGSRKYVFMHEGSLQATGTRYIVVHLLGYMINLGLMAILADKFGYPHQWVQLVAIFVVAVFLFIAFKFFVFRDGESVQAKVEG